MNKTPRRIVFNLYAQPSFGQQATYMYTNDPVIRLEEQGGPQPRNAVQLEHLSNRALPTDDPIFGSSLAWAFGSYIVHRLSASDEGIQPSELPTGLEPPQAIDQALRSRQLEAIWAGGGGSRPLCLFNVLVALEWNPSRRYLRQLEWAFRRASDFLYDVTDGYMAFGQVVFGDVKWMDCADIQIMASNRFHPRSWTNGLHDPRKYTPIRVGRGIWHKNNRVTIPWDEPEAYRTLIHEWGHYALALKDEYLSQKKVKPAAPNSSRLVDAESGGRKETVVVPGISLAVESIMSTLATSELLPQSERNSSKRKSNEWGKLAAKAEFSFLRIARDHQPLDGPLQLPMPLPRFQRVGALADLAADADDLILTIPDDLIQYEHCWVYLLEGEPASPKRLLVQGTLDARAEDDGFRLLGAQPGQQVILIGLSPERTTHGGEPVVLCAEISAAKSRAIGGKDAQMTKWKTVTPRPFPMVDVVPAPDSASAAGRDTQGSTSQNSALRQIYVRLADIGLPKAGSADGFDLLVFPLGGTEPIAVRGPTDPIQVSSLDGHVLVRSKDGTQMTICTYSQGGGPGASPPVQSNPTTAGSAEGNVMLFFFDPEQGPAHGDEALPYEQLSSITNDKYGHIKVITTMNHGVSAESDMQPRSYVFSIASNDALPDYDPTLVMYYDTDTERQGGELRICREVGGKWQNLPTYLPEGYSYAATPFNDKTAETLVARNPKGERIERYRLYWAPGDRPAAT
jgi:hypothetical protein